MSKRILLIDSDENFAQGLQKAILASGFTAVTATDSEQGMTLAREESPDLIVVSVEAQPTNGYMLCTRLKKDDALKGIPVILTSSNATEDSFEKHKKLKTRAEEYMIKPFAPSLMVQKAAALLGVAAPSSQSGDEALEEEIVSMEDEPMGLGDLVEEEDEPIRLTDGEAAAAHEPEVEILEDSVEVEIEDEQDEPLAREAPEHPPADDDLQLFDRAFDAIGMPGEEPAAAPPKQAPPRPLAAAARAAPPRAATPRAVPPPRAAAPDDDELAFEALDALDESQDAVIDDPVEPVARPSPTRGGLAGARVRGAAPDEPTRRASEANAGLRPGSGGNEIQRAKEARTQAEKEIKRLQELLEAKEKEIGDLQTQAEELRDESARHETASKTQQQRSDTLSAAAKKLERELAQVREELNAAAGEKDLLTEEREDLRQRLSAAEAEAARNEERAVKAYQKMKGDERLREKTRKALQVALQLLEEGAAAAEGRETGPEKQSA